MIVLSAVGTENSNSLQREQVIKGARVLLAHAQYMPAEVFADKTLAAFL